MKRPRSWLVLGILQICFGAYGIIGGLGLLAMPWLMEFLASIPGTAADRNLQMSIDMTREQASTNAVIGIAYAVLGIWQIIAGIGLVRFRPWARVQNLAYVAIDIPFIIAYSAINYLAQQQALAKYPDLDGLQFARAVGLPGAIVGAGVTLAWPIVLLALLSRSDPFSPTAGDAHGGADDHANPYRPPGHSGG